MDDLFEIFEVFGLGEGLFAILEWLVAIVGFVAVLALFAALVILTDTGLTGILLAGGIGAAGIGVGAVAGMKYQKLKSKY
jgi:hypothetical protein